MTHIPKPYTVYILYIEESVMGIGWLGGIQNAGPTP